MHKQPPTIGPKAVIIGNGPSVDAVPPSVWGVLKSLGWSLIGTNRALVFEALQGVALDVMVIRDGYRDLWLDKQAAWSYHRHHWQSFAGWKVGPSNERVTHCDQFVRFLEGWQHEPVRDTNHELAVMKQSSVVLMAANWAWLHGVRQMTLVGVDYTGGDCARCIAPFNQSTGWEGRYTKPVPANIRREFGTARAAIESARGSIVNASRGTMLTEIPTVDIEALCSAS
jgi:hypothetical protein